MTLLAAAGCFAAGWLAHRLFQYALKTLVVGRDAWSERVVSRLDHDQFQRLLRVTLVEEKRRRAA